MDLSEYFCVKWSSPGVYNDQKKMGASAYFSLINRSSPGVCIDQKMYVSEYSSWVKLSSPDVCNNQMKMDLSEYLFCKMIFPWFRYWSEEDVSEYFL